MHLVDVAHGIMGSSAVVGTTVPNSVGYALALKQQGKNAIVVSFFGDGATEEGAFFESLNFAALKNVPLIFVCENNGYAIHTSIRKRQKSTDLCAKARAFGIESELIRDNDVLALYEASRERVDKLRNGYPGPFFLEVQTYRWKEHVGPGEDYGLG